MLQFPVFAPKNKYRFSWDLIVVVGIVYSAIFVPLDVASNDKMSPLGYIFDNIFLAIFFLDVLVNFNTGVWKNVATENTVAYLLQSISSFSSINF